MTTTAIVIGAGITGLSAALWLQRAGVAVTLIDRIDPGASEQASYGNAGLLSRSAVIPSSYPGLLFKAPFLLFNRDQPLYLKWRHLPRFLPWLVPFLRNGHRAKVSEISTALAALTHDSVEQHRALAADGAAASYIKSGDYAYYYRTKADYRADAQGLALRAKAGFEAVELDRKALKRRDPALSDAYQFAALFRDHGWITSPGKYSAALAKTFREIGGVFVKSTVQDVADGRVSLLNGETLFADKIVLAGGAWSGELARKLGQIPKLEAERGYHIHLKGASYLPPSPLMVSDAKFVATPMEDGLRCAGIVEFGGLNAPPSDAPIALLRKRIRQVYPDLTWQSEQVWMGFRPSTPDSLPHLGPLRDAPNVICAFGGQHIGMTIGPKLGRLVADMVAGRRINLDLAPYEANRFS
ncbi:MAG: FAD-binding oxidoreductase [Alphaproteobacteria bacterium]|nr:FAD-binding oxidoreductase [Alphaproteobacteria bacterium]